MIVFEKKEVTALKRRVKSTTPRGRAARAAADDSDSVPNEFRCSITLELMKDPVMLLDGHS
jgi:hypothetical protein